MRSEEHLQRRVLLCRGTLSQRSKHTQQGSEKEIRIINRFRIVIKVLLCISYS